MLLFQILEALNKGEIPSTGSLVEVFNKVILERCLKLYNQRMDRLGLPLPVDKLQQAHDESKKDARKLFDEQHFGHHHAGQSFLKLDDEMDKVHLGTLCQQWCSLADLYLKQTTSLFSV